MSNSEISESSEEKEIQDSSELAAGDDEAQGAEEIVLAGLLEALLIAHGEPLTKERLVQISGATEEEIEQALAGLAEKYAAENSGIFLARMGASCQIRTKPQFAHYLRQLRAELPRRLSPPALETLAIVAYRQPIVRSDVEKIRGVDAGPTLKTLLERGLIKILGHQSTVGQPALYGTTDEFLKLFGLSSLGELPTLRDLQEIDQAVQEESGVESGEEREPELEEGNLPQ